MIRILRGMYQFVHSADYARLHHGFAAGGPQDRFSCELANHLLGNDRSAGAIEFTLAPAVIRIECDCLFIVGGAPCEIKIDGVPQREWAVTLGKAGSEIRIQIGQTGCRVYLCVAGGLHEDGAFVGDSLAAKVGEVKRADCGDWEPPMGTLRVLPGPEWSSAAGEVLTGQAWEIAPQSNSVGLRLIGPTLPTESYDILSSAVQDGTIQATKTGLLALLRDRGTLGGYPRVATVIDCDVDRLAQFRPGQQIRFQIVDESQARQAFQKQQQAFC